jgi:hypothetical protein
VSLDYTKVIKHNDIITPATAVLIANTAAFPNAVIRGTPNSGQTVGPIVQINDTTINAPEAFTSSYNLEVDYTLKTVSAGTWKLSGIANFWQHYVVQSTIGAPALEQLGNPDATPISGGLGTGAELAKFKGNLGLDWMKGSFSAGWLVRYVGPYTDGSYYGIGGPDPWYTGTVNGWIPGQIYHDAYVGYKLDEARKGGSWWRQALAQTSIRFGVKNLFNRVPPFDGMAFNYMSAYGDVRLAEYYLTFKKRL